MNVSTALSKTANILKEAGISDPRKEAASLMAFVLSKDAAFLIAHSEDELSEEQQIRFESYAQRRAKREPFQYIVGRQEFYGLDFIVTPDVLIPRPETEILVENAVKTVSPLEDPTLLEVGVGTGCISIAILANVTSAAGVGVDISPAALGVAVRNAEKHGVSGRLDLRQGDVYEGLGGRMFDLIVSNPPYVRAGEIDLLQPEVRDHEPHAALDGGDDGLDIIQTIIREAPQFIKPRGHLLLEIGHDQSGSVGELFDRRIWSQPEFICDLQGILRVVKSEFRMSESGQRK